MSIGELSSMLNALYFKSILFIGGVDKFFEAMLVICTESYFMYCQNYQTRLGFIVGMNILEII